MSNEAKKTVDLEKIRDDYKAAAAKIKRRIIICAGTGCVANGSLEVRDALAEALKKAGVDVALELRKEEEHTGTYISKSGCQGFCQMGPLLHIEPGDILYTKVKVADVPEIVERTLQRGEVIDRLLFVHPKTGAHCKGDADIPFYNRQKRVVLANCRIEPGCVREYIARGGYFGARKAILEMTPEEVCQTAIDSGLRGRGGGGFPTGLKWKFTLASKNDKKYVICNGDEGDPGAFMDRSVMEGNPHAVIEGMMIAARGIGADEGYVYVRAEYLNEHTRIDGADGQQSEAMPVTFGVVIRRLNNRLAPTKGYAVEAQVGVAAEPLLTDKSFIRSYLKGLRLQTVSENSYLVLRGELGAVFSDGKSGIPSTLMFRTGGDQSVRGYAYESLGVREGDATVGGRYLAVASAEYQYYFLKNWGVAFFVDAGNAGDTVSELDPAVGYGIGGRWRSPAGPVGVDLAYGERTGNFRLHFSLGFTF